MNKKLRHRHWPLGRIRCIFRPCEPALSEETRRATYKSFEERKAELRAAVKEERDRLYALIDNGADVDDDPLLAHVARNRGTLKGPVRRVPTGERREIPSGEIHADVETAEARRLRLQEEDRERIKAAHTARAEAAREARLDRLRRGEI